MAKRSRKKKAERSDFAKVRLKVGRRLPKNLNETRISLATGKILVRDQRLSLGPELIESDQQQQQLPHQPRLLLRKLRSPQLSERVSAAAKLARWIASPSTTMEAARHLFAFNELAEYLAPCLRDARSSELRSAAGKIFAGLLERGKLGDLPVFTAVLFQSIRSCWTHLDAAIQSEAVALLDSLMAGGPAACQLDLAPRILRLFSSRLGQRRSTKQSSLSSADAAAGNFQLMRTRNHLMALAVCAGRFAGLLADDAAARRPLEECGAAAAAAESPLFAKFDLNEAVWAPRRSAWIDGGDRTVMMTLDSGPDDAGANGEFADDSAGSGDEADPEADPTAVVKFESGLASLIKELLPADFSGSVGGSTAYGELLALLKCLRNLLALHCWGKNVRQGNGCGCRAQQQQSSSQARKPALHKLSSTTCSMAVGDLLAATLCPQFPLTVLSSAPSAGNQLATSATKSQRRSRSKDSLRDVAAKAKELNLLVVECALICAPQLELEAAGSFGQLQASSSSAASSTLSAQPFVLAVYRFLAAAYRGRISATDSTFWLRTGGPIVLRHPGTQLSRLLLAFFADSMAAGRFEAPLPVASFLTRVACQQGLPLPLLDDLPRRLVEQFDSAQLHLVAAGSSVGDADVDTANSAVRCLLELAARNFPGAADAVAAASDRLVRFCPDRVLRRSLSASLGLAS